MAEKNNIEIKVGKEEWKSIDGFEGLYEVSNMGRVRNKDGLILRGSYSSRGGYHTVSLFKQGKKIWRSVHRLVAIAFIPNPEHKPVVNHIDENKTNNCVSNLEWVTQKENMNCGSISRRISERNRKYYATHLNPKSKAVRCVETGKIYSSGMCACRALGLPKGSVSGVLMGKHHTAGGYHWEFA